jgi:hypothetical protein
MQNHYNPRSGTVTMRPDASLYAHFHELAHKDQHKELAWPYLFWCALRRLRLVGKVVTIWIEYDAYRRARSRLERLGHWTEEAEKEARRMLMSYIKPKPETV